MITRRLLIAGCCTVIAILTSGVAERFYVAGASHHRQEWTTRNSPKLSAVLRSLRPNYPYSVVPGGVYSIQELRLIKNSDQLVNRHYADFNDRSAYLVTTTEDRYKYASYRKKGQIYWTERKLRIPKGEMLITDGKNFIRTRCGNRLSDQAPTNAVAAAPLALYFAPTPFDLTLAGNRIPTFASGPTANQALLPLLPMLVPVLTVSSLPEDLAGAVYPGIGWVPGMPQSRSAARTGSTGNTGGAGLGNNTGAGSGGSGSGSKGSPTSAGTGKLPITPPIISGRPGLAPKPVTGTTPGQIVSPTGVIVAPIVVLPINVAPISVITPVPEPRSLTPIGLALLGVLGGLVYKSRRLAAKLVDGGAPIPQ